MIAHNKKKQEMNEWGKENNKKGDAKPLRIFRITKERKVSLVIY